MQLFHEYFREWMELFKKENIRSVTYKKYQMTQKRLSELAPDLKIGQLDKRSYQILLNDYAQTHEKQTVLDFHHHLKSSIIDAIDDGLLKQDPTRKAVIKGKPANKRLKYLSKADLIKMLSGLNLNDNVNWDWFILLSAKTGLRFAETLGLTPNDFDFEKCSLSVKKTWDYKNGGGFAPTKNESSIRAISIDDILCKQFCMLTNSLPPNEPIFVKDRVYNSTVNMRLKRLCLRAGVPVISLHGLRHTHASLLIYAGVSIASIAKRLGHSSVTTTQETYLHIIKELEDRDNEKIITCIGELA